MSPWFGFASDRKSTQGEGPEEGLVCPQIRRAVYVFGGPGLTLVHSSDSSTFSSGFTQTVLSGESHQDGNK